MNPHRKAVLAAALVFSAISVFAGDGDKPQKLNDQGITVVMVTHELDIARYTKRNVIMRDGQVVTDVAVTNRLQAEVELQRLTEAQQAVQLAP